LENVQPSIDGPAFDGDEVRTVGVVQTNLAVAARGFGPGRRPPVAASSRRGRRFPGYPLRATVQREIDERRRGRCLQHDRMSGAGERWHGVARRDWKLPGAAIVGAPRQLDLDQPVARAPTLVCRDEIPAPGLSDLVPVHHAERGGANGARNFASSG